MKRIIIGRKLSKAQLTTLTLSSLQQWAHVICHIDISKKGVLV